MPRADTGSFNRLLTSVGLLLLGAALVVPYFFFRNTDTLEIPAGDLRQMTAIGRAALLDRQEAIVAMEPWVVAAAVLLGVMGAALVIIGALRLKDAQQSDDEESELRRARARLEFEEMSPAEQKERDSRQAKVEVEEELSSAAAVEAESHSEPAAPPLSLTLDPRARAEAIARISSRIAGAFRNLEPAGYTFRSQVRIGSARDEVRLDGVFNSRVDQRQDVLLRVRVSSDPRLLRRNAKNIADDLIATMNRYRILTANPVTGWLVMVVPEEAESVATLDAHGRAMDSLRAALEPFGRVTLVNERNLDTLPDQFEELFHVA